MDTCRSSRLSLRQLAFLFALAAVLLPAGVAEAAKKKKVKPVVTSVRPMDAEVGDVLSIHGKYFRPGRGTNTVVFKRDGYKAVFVKADVATRRLIKVKVPGSLEEFMVSRGTAKLPTVFRIRILAKRFGKSFTTDSRSPKIGPDTPPPPPPPPSEAKPQGDCDGNGTLNQDQADDDSDGLSDDVELSLGLDPCVGDSDKDGVEDTWEFDCDRDRALNRDESDDDDDLLSDSLEGTIMTDPCSGDTDGDSVADGFEFRSAVDLNDDEYQEPNQSLPYPGKRPYPNPLDNGDRNVDFDGDALTLVEEYKLWQYTITARGAARTLDPLSYSDGLQHSSYRRATDNRRKPDLAAAGYERHQNFLDWAQAAGYATIQLVDVDEWWYADGSPFHITDFNRDGESTAAGFNSETLEIYYRDEATYFDGDQDGWLDDGERDEDADGLTNFDESHGCMMDHAYWAKLYSKETPYGVKYAGTRLDDGDSDGDGVRDGADDQDHDDLPNVMECSRQAASGRDYDPIKDAPDPANPEPRKGHVNPFNPCLPSTMSRTCNRNPELGNLWAPFNADDKIYYVWN